MNQGLTHMSYLRRKLKILSPSGEKISVMLSFLNTFLVFCLLEELWVWSVVWTRVFLAQTF